MGACVGVVQCVAACACRVWWVRDFCYLPVSVVIWADGDNVENRGSPFFGQAVLGVVCVCLCVYVRSVCLCLCVCACLCVYLRVCACLCVGCGGCVTFATYPCLW